VGTVFRLLVGDVDERERQIAEAMAEFLFDEPEDCACPSPQP
jgi:hypothetical protein